ncbi:hydrogenase [Geomonas limicola]|uniref:Hydrogenase n=1 Tax=Geomonas limicola TaxID=2740186 RepID=A0A6V8N9U2_9BACT|nr:4Fe-4S dicluster domain-containing protein [Geomonas limicola]GFO69210.1 hydrogenase [Geomonas limicola]
MENSAYLAQESLQQFLDTLGGFGTLHAPTWSESGVSLFAPVRSLDEIDLGYRRTQIPPKKYLFPFRDTFLEYREGHYRFPDGTSPATVLFGVHACDLEAIAYLDLVFLSEPRDPRYAERRAKLLLVGISCTPDEYCFCSEPQGSARCDLFLEAREGGFRVHAGTAAGAAMLGAASELLQEADAAPSGRAPSCLIPAQDPARAYSRDPLWDEFARRCVGCGACSACCPTCYCFDVRETPGLSGDGSRVREWDNCLFPSHGAVAGGNFRPTRLDRLRYRFLHKYCGFSPLEGRSSCVGCGRCKELCPVDIDLRELVAMPRGETEQP